MGNAEAAFLVVAKFGGRIYDLRIYENPFYIVVSHCHKDTLAYSSLRTCKSHSVRIFHCLEHFFNERSEIIVYFFRFYRFGDLSKNFFPKFCNSHKDPSFLENKFCKSYSQRKSHYAKNTCRHADERGVRFVFSKKNRESGYAGGARTQTCDVNYVTHCTKIRDKRKKFGCGKNIPKTLLK